MVPPHLNTSSGAVEPSLPDRGEEQAAVSPDILLSGFTHDLRSPLFAVLGYLQLLQRSLEISGPEKALAYVRQARDAGLRLDQMVTEMLDLLRFDQGPITLQREAVSVSTLFQRLWNTFGVIAQNKQVNLRMILKDDEALTAQADFRLLERALDNLIGNAIKFSFPGGEVIVIGQRIHHGVAFEVADRGCGIPAEAHGRIFEPFAQVRNSDHPMGYGMGFGMGLAIVKFIAKAHQGEVSVSSVPGQGSHFTFWIPDRP
jgi:two-component system sensor histidine kinase ResE